MPDVDPDARSAVEATVLARDAEKFLAVIDRVLELDYLEPELRRRVLELRERMARDQLGAGGRSRKRPPTV